MSRQRKESIAEETGPFAGTPVKWLHPATLWVPLLGSLPTIAVVAAIATFVLGAGRVLFIGFWYVLLPATAYHVLRYLSFRYRLQVSELSIRSGLLWRHERRIPLSRIQDTRLHQGPFHQVFGVVRLEITTAAAEEREAVLDVISKGEAVLLKDAFFRHQTQVEAAIELGSSAPEPEDCLLRLTVRDLLIGGLTSKLIATVAALIGVIFYFTLFLALVGGFFSHWEQYATGWERWFLPNLGGWFEYMFYALSWDDTLVGSVLLVLGGLSISLARFAIRYYGFQLTRVGEVVTKTHGLFTVRADSLARNRVQALKVEEGLLRRWFGLATVWADSGGDRNQLDEEKKRDPLVPVTSRSEAYSLVRLVLAGLPEPEPRWERVSRKAIWRGSKVGWLLLLLITAQSCLAFGWLGLMWLPGFPLIYYLNVKWYRNTGYWVDGHYLISRKGWFNRKTLYLPVRNLQNVSLSQSYFDRRLQLATLSADTAGQANTGGGPSIRNLPQDKARSIQKELARRVASMAPAGDSER